MKAIQLDISNKDIKSIANKVVNKKETMIGNKSNSTGTKIEIKGQDIDRRLGSDILFTIYFDRVPMSEQMTVRFFWGNNCRIDIIGKDENGKRLSNKEIVKLLVEGLKEYIHHRNNNPYGTINVDNFKPDF